MSSGRTIEGGLVPIGVPQADYNVHRNVVGSMPAWAIRRRPVDRFRLMAAMRARAGLPACNAERFSFGEPYWPRVRLLHLFNSIAGSRTPWVCSFETMLPRWGDVVLPDWDIPERQLRRAVRMMRGDACNRLLAISDAARRLLIRRWHARLPKSDADHLESKVEVLLPPQPVLTEVRHRFYGEQPRFLFVGSEFYRKGGLELLEALQRLWDRGERGWSALLVGRLGSFGDRASRTTTADRDRARSIISRLSPALSHRESLPREDVLRELRDADFYVLPTLQDSFGYGVLEAQACGAVTICSNVRALPEMVSPDTGFLISLPLDVDGEVHHEAESMPSVKAELLSGLEDMLGRALRLRPPERASMAERAQKVLRSRFGVERHRDRLDRLYRSMLGAQAP